MINLKTAFRAQNTLKNAIDSITAYLSNKSNVSTITSVHRKSKAVETKTDETLVAEKPYDFKTNEIIGALMCLISEKETLTEEINKSKKSLDIDIDGKLSMNLTTRKAISAFKSMCSIKESVKTTYGRDYTFNVEGNQVQYVYDIDQTTKPDFDTPELRSYTKQLENNADEISNKLDEVYISTQVDYTPIIGDNDTLEEILKIAIDKSKNSEPC